MKQKYLIAALMAGMLVLAGCGGGNNSTKPANDDMSGDDMAMPDPAAACGPGTEYNSTTMMCQVDQAAAKMKEAAEAEANAVLGLIGGYITDTFSGEGPRATPAGFTSAKDDNKGHAMITVDGRVLALDRGESFLTVTSGNPLAESSEFGGLNAKTHNRPVGDTLQDFTATGTYDGIAGTFTCTGDDACKSQGGAPISNGDTAWTFTPDNPEEKTKVDIKWGWWITRNDEGTVTGIDIFRNAAGSHSAITTAPLAVAGTAKYSGEAVGLYAMDGESGGFTATANLTADFVAGSHTDTTISGEITGFMVDNKSRNWKVELAKDARASTVANFAGAATWIIDGEEGDSGAWTATTYGGTGAMIPNIVTGKFHVNGDESKILGVFGTQHQE